MCGVDNVVIQPPHESCHLLPVDLDGAGAQAARRKMRGESDSEGIARERQQGDHERIFRDSAERRGREGP